MVVKFDDSDKESIRWISNFVSLDSGKQLQRPILGCKHLDRQKSEEQWPSHSKHSYEGQWPTQSKHSSFSNPHWAGDWAWQQD
eukprot:2115918-Karenia_brevis.AAC.1